MNTPPFCVLINPHRYPGYVRKLKKILRKVPRASVYEAENEEKFAEGIKDFLRSDDKYILVWGGDGTAHLAINTWMKNSPGGQEKNKAIGFLRGGSGNGIQDSYEVPYLLSRQITEYLHSMEQGFTQEVDLLSVGSRDERRYAQLVGTGFDAEILRRREESIQRHNGKARGMIQYLTGGISLFFEDFFSYRRKFLISMEKGKYALRGTRANAEQGFASLEYEQSPLMLEVGTRPFYGRMFKVCPDVVCNDGRMDVYQFMFENRRQILMNFLSLWNGWHNRINRHQAEKGRPLIERYEVERMQISSTEPFLYHLDGELQICENTSGNHRLELEVAPLALRFLVPESFHRKFHPASLYDQGNLRK